MKPGIKYVRIYEIWKSSLKLKSNLIGLLQRVEEGLQAGEMANQLENPQDSHDTENLSNTPHLRLVVRMFSIALSLVNVNLNQIQSETQVRL